MVVVIVVIVVYKFTGQGTPQVGPAPVHVPAGQVVSGFPEQLLTGGAASGTKAVASTSMPQVTNSYSINYSSSTNQYTTEWVSSSSLAAILGNYKSSLPAQGWTITGVADKSTYKGIYAVNTAGAQLNITIQPVAFLPSAGSKVTVSYLNVTQGQ